MNDLSSPMTWIIPRQVAAMARPTTDDMVRLLGLGITGLLSLTEEASRIGQVARELGLLWLHLPIDDFDTPTVQQIDEGVTFMREQVDAGNAVAVHCGAGLGRTGTMIACYLVSTGVPPDQAIEHVRRLRPGSIETNEQEASVRRYHHTRRDAAP